MTTVERPLHPPPARGADDILRPRARRRASTRERRRASPRACPMTDTTALATEARARRLRDAVAVYLAFAVSKASRPGTLAVRLGKLRRGRLRDTLRPAGALDGVGLRGDQSLCGELAETSIGTAHSLCEVLERLLQPRRRGSACNRGCRRPIDQRRQVVSTDPPYYDNVGYADLSDFFYVWLRRSLRPVLPGISSPRWRSRRPRSWLPRLPPRRQGEGRGLLPRRA